MTFDPYSIDLPVRDIIEQTRSALARENTLIVSAPAGAGKSTLLPLALIDQQWLDGRKILMLEPRRLAAKTIAARMASLLDEQLGQTIGYRIRFESRLGKDTSIEVVTEGILTRMLQNDSALEGVGMVIFDEFHERSIHADVALALCREAQQVLRPDLRIMIMSATLDMNKLETLLKAPVIQSSGRQYPVNIIYTSERDDYKLSEITARTVVRAVGEQTGDTLVFLPGEREIKRCQELLIQHLPDFAIHPLYGMLSGDRQQAAILPDPHGRRKVVLATSIAETSLTIEGIHTVVDSGFSRTQLFDPKTGLSRLETVDVSIDSADQRAGRAGRLGPGTCYRMWSKATHSRLKKHRVPEIMVADLSSLVLDMAMWGVTDITQMEWLTQPPQGALIRAGKNLCQLKALDNKSITPHGRQMLKLPCHPRISHMLLMAKDEGLLSLATDLAALLEDRDPLARDSGIDINLRIEALRRHRRGDRAMKAFYRIEKNAVSYRKLFNIKPDNDPVDPWNTGVLLVYAYPERIAFARSGNNGQFQMANGNIAFASNDDDLAHESWLAIAHVDARDGMGKIFLASSVNPEDLTHLIRKREVIMWDSRKGGVIASLEHRIGSIILQSKPLSSPDKDAICSAISQAVEREGTHLLNFSDKVIQWQNRVMSMRKWRPEQGWPDVTTETLLKNNRRWLTPYLDNIRKVEDLKKIDLEQVLHSHLEWELQSKLDILAPSRIKVPSGSNIKLLYQSNGSAPVLAVRIQEVFGLEQTPRVNDGRVSVLMHLLSPAFRPIQITSDLSSFWDYTYYDVRKELRIRYAKHYWPEDPKKAEAVRGARRRSKS